MDSLLDEYISDRSTPGGLLFDVAHIEQCLRLAASEGRAFSYSELLMELGYRFTRPKMRALCKVLDEVDRMARAADQPELAVLVVREGDRLPGQGWWTGRRDYDGASTGPDALAFITKVQSRAFAHWSLAKRDD